MIVGDVVGGLVPQTSVEDEHAAGAHPGWNHLLAGHSVLGRTRPALAPRHEPGRAGRLGVIGDRPHAGADDRLVRPLQRDQCVVGVHRLPIPAGQHVDGGEGREQGARSEQALHQGEDLRLDRDLPEETIQEEQACRAKLGRAVHG